MTEEREALLYGRIVDHVERSIRFGSGVTGAPGQPVKTGALRDSFIEEGSRAARLVTISSTLPYAHDRENNFRHATQRSSVGGSHSVKITRLNWRLIVAHELAIVKAQVNV